MSPASQGVLEVERYIGSCLISSNARSLVGLKKQQQDCVLLRGNQQREYNQQGHYTLGNEQCQYGTWAGTPLISMTSSPRRNNQRSSPPACQNSHQQNAQQQQQDQQIQSHLQSRSPLSRLAIHTQGAPLILAGRQHNRGKIQSCTGMNGTSINNSGVHVLNSNVNGNTNNFCNGNNVNVASGGGIGNSMIMSAGRCVPARGQRLAEPTRKPQQPQQSQQQQMNAKTECTNGKIDNPGTHIANIDSLSIASDESSGSNNSENSLPRIIKPRKRRKKDRKPACGTTVVPEIQSKPEEQQQQQQNQQHQHQSNGSGISEQSSIVTLKPYVPVCYDTRYEPHRGQRRPPPIGRESYPRSQSQITSCNGSMQQQQLHQQQQQIHQQQQEIVDTRQQHQHQQQQQQQQRYPQRHAQVKVLDDNRNVVAPTSTSTMSVRSMGLAVKGINGSNSSYHHRNHHHHVAHHHHHHHHHHNENRNGNSTNNSTPMIGNGNVPSLSRHRYVQNHQHQTHHQQQHKQQSQHDYNEPMLMGCEDNTALIDGPLGSAGCQCRYCDPSGLIWDVDQNGYSPFLTPPHGSEFSATPDYGVPQQQFAHLPLFLSRAGPTIACQEQALPSGCEYFDLADSGPPVPRGHHNLVSRLQDMRYSESVVTTNNNSCNGQSTAPGTMLRRSWSDPTSYFSEEISVPNRDVGVIGDRGQNDVTRGRSSWPGSLASGLTSGGAGNSPYGNLANLPVSSPGLEVSTEIVTSPNGHRDLEIKFYSSSPNAAPAEEDKSAFLDDGEDFSDIWSYHESKLQQDFRTLLQAEEWLDAKKVESVWYNFMSVLKLNDDNTRNKCKEDWAYG